MIKAMPHLFIFRNTVSKSRAHRRSSKRQASFIGRPGVARSFDIADIACDWKETPPKEQLWCGNLVVAKFANDYFTQIAGCPQAHVFHARPRLGLRVHATAHTTPRTRSLLPRDAALLPPWLPHPRPPRRLH